MWGGLGGAETTRGRRLVLNIQGCPGNASPKPKSGPTALLFFLIFLSPFLGVSRQGEFKVQKHHRNIFTKKSTSKTFPRKINKISMSGFPRLLLFYRVFGCFSATGVQKHYKKHSTKNRVE
jgi:hypothetical protein